MLNYRIIFRTMGFLLIGEALFMLLPLIISIIYQSGDSSAFVYSSLITFGAGALSVALTFKAPKKLGKSAKATLLWALFGFSSLFLAPYPTSSATPYHRTTMRFSKPCRGLPLQVRQY
jgi:trk system potassium uptake protein